MRTSAAAALMLDGRAVSVVSVHDAGQRQQILALLGEGFPDVKLDWSAAFEARPGRNGHGYLLIADGRPEGAMLAFEKAETIGGRERRIVNLSSWYIRPKFRRFAVRMIRTIISEPDTIFNACSPIRSVQAIFRRVGFRYVSHGMIVSVPLLNGFAAGRAVSIESLTPALAPPEHRRWLADHDDARHIAIRISRAGQAIPVLWMRGLKVKGFPAARLLFTPDHDLLRAALPAIHAHMLRRHGIVGLYLPRVAALADLRSARKHDRGPSIMVYGDIPDTDVNLLYSELLYLRT